MKKRTEPENAQLAAAKSLRRTIESEIPDWLSSTEILNNDLTPARLHRDVGTFYTDISNRIYFDTLPKIREALAFGECGYAGCPGTTDGTVCPGPKAHPPVENAQA
jgi:hypothetical protein